MHGIERYLFQLPDPYLKIYKMDFIKEILKETIENLSQLERSQRVSFLPEVRNFCASLIQDW